MRLCLHVEYKISQIIMNATERGAPFPLTLFEHALSLVLLAFWESTGSIEW